MTQNTKNIADIGCGTSVLSLIMSQYQLPRIYAIDNNENSLYLRNQMLRPSDTLTI
jgi:ribosomal protein L11 methylase PrmA